MKILTKQDKYLLFSRKTFSSGNNWRWKLLSLCLHFYNHRLLMLVTLDVSWNSSGSHHHKGLYALSSLLLLSQGLSHITHFIICPAVFCLGMNLPVRAEDNC